MSKLEQAARQALEALERWRDWDDSNNTAAWGLDDEDAITALREALAGDNMTSAGQAELNLNCKSIQARLATSRWYVKSEQAEQEPVGEVVMESMGVGDAQIVRFRMNGRIPPVGTKLYAAPVRTKDLTEEDINELWNTALMIADPTAGNLRFKFGRAVIAAYKEKNQWNS